MVTIAADDIDGYILTGGNSSRMGEAKGRLTLGGRTLVERVAAALSPRVRRVFTVGDADEYPGIENIPDAVSDGTRSSMAGLYSALAAAETEWIFVVACDMPFLSPELFEAIAACRAPHRGAVVPLGENDVPQPMCALYRVAACLSECERAIASGNLGLQGLLKRVDAFQIAFGELRHLDGSEHFFKNLNTPTEFANAARLVENA